MSGFRGAYEYAARHVFGAASGLRPHSFKCSATDTIAGTTENSGHSRVRRENFSQLELATPSVLILQTRRIANRVLGNGLR
jgi:hypothetical protein